MDWETDAAGDIIVHPLADWQTLTAGGVAILLRLDGLPSVREPKRPAVSLQVGMSAAQATELAQALLRKVQQVTSPPPLHQN